MISWPARALFALAILGATGFAAGQTANEDQLLQLYGDKATISIATGALQPLGRAPITLGSWCRNVPCSML